MGWVLLELAGSNPFLFCLLGDTISQAQEKDGIYLCRLHPSLNKNYLVGTDNRANPLCAQVFLRQFSALDADAVGFMSVGDSLFQFRQILDCSEIP